MQLPTSYIHKFVFVIAGLVYGLCVVLLLAWVFPGTVILPQYLSLGPVRLYIYGICLALAFSMAFWLAMRRKELYGVTQSQAETIVVIIGISGFIGARLYHVLTAWDYYLAHPLYIPMLWRGGLSIFGAMLGAIIGLLLYYRLSKNSFDVWKVLDWIAPSIAIGQVIGRFGNLFNYELYGYPTSIWWKMFVPVEFRISPYEMYQYFHPLFLYESIGCLLIVVVLLWLPKKLPVGSLFLIWLLLYNGMRFFSELLRIDSTYIGNVRLNLIVAACLCALAVVGLWYLHAPKNSSSHQ